MLQVNVTQSVKINNGLYIFLFLYFFIFVHISLRVTMRKMSTSFEAKKIMLKHNLGLGSGSSPIYIKHTFFYIG